MKEDHAVKSRVGALPEVLSTTTNATVLLFSRRHQRRRIADFVEFQENLTGDGDVVLLDVFESDDDALVEADVGEDLSGAGADARHRATLRRLGRVVLRRPSQLSILPSTTWKGHSAPVSYTHLTLPTNREV